jgi:hypothetical protein
MRQLVREQSIASRCPGRIVPGCEHDVAPTCCIGDGPDRVRRRRSHGVGVDAHVPEVVAEAGLETLADLRRQRAPRVRHSIQLGAMKTRGLARYGNARLPLHA